MYLNMPVVRQLGKQMSQRHLTQPDLKGQTSGCHSGTKHADILTTSLKPPQVCFILFPLFLLILWWLARLSGPVSVAARDAWMWC